MGYMRTQSKCFSQVLLLVEPINLNAREKKSKDLLHNEIEKNEMKCDEQKNGKLKKIKIKNNKKKRTLKFGSQHK